MPELFIFRNLGRN